MDNVTYKTIRKNVEATGEFYDRKSRFIAQIIHVESQEEADLFKEEIISRHHDARHNVPAWILSDDNMRCSDDGEPQRTAGMPTLEVLLGENLKDVCCVVTRYFGGTLLGPGGLIRAYTAATQNAIQNALEEDKIAVMCEVVDVVVHLTYPLYDQVLHLANENNAKVKDTIYTDKVDLKLVFKKGEEVPFVQRVKELASGEDLCEVSEPMFSEF